MDNKRNLLGYNSASNQGKTPLVQADEDGSALERIEYLQVSLTTIDGIVDNVLESTCEIETHLHSSEKWFGKSVAGNETNAATRGSLTPFRVDSGNNDWGTAVCILGTDDTPVSENKTYFDLHELLFVAFERASETHIFRISWGDTEAEAIAAEQYSEQMLFPTAQIRTVPSEFRCRRIPAGTKVWANCKCANNTGYMDFHFGIHEYNN